jgi:hypothetical protein
MLARVLAPRRPHVGFAIARRRGGGVVIDAFTFIPLPRNQSNRGPPAAFTIIAENADSSWRRCDLMSGAA